MQRKNIPLYLVIVALAIMTGCKSTKPTSEKSTNAESTQTQLKKREADSPYTKQAAYISL